MNQKYYFLLIWASLSFASATALAGGIDADSTDARAVMKAVQERPAGDRKVSRMQLTIQDSGGRTRERMLQLLELDFDESKKSMVFFESPADVRNVALLTVDYNASAKSDDQWLFMPKLRRTTRIGSSKRSSAFMGSDFTYGDMTQLNPELYHYQILKQDILVSGENCWLIEARPRTEAEKEQSGSLKQHLWVSKSSLIPIRMKSWVRKGKKLRYLSQENIKLIDGVWTTFVTRARTVRNGKVESESSLEILQVQYGVNSITAAEFNLRNLEKGI